MSLTLTHHNGFPLPPGLAAMLEFTDPGVTYTVVFETMEGRTFAFYGPEKSEGRLIRAGPLLTALEKHAMLQLPFVSEIVPVTITYVLPWDKNGERYLVGIGQELLWGFQGATEDVRDFVYRLLLEYGANGEIADAVCRGVMEKKSIKELLWRPTLVRLQVTTDVFQELLAHTRVRECNAMSSGDILTSIDEYVDGTPLHQLLEKMFGDFLVRRGPLGRR